MPALRSHGGRAKHPGEALHLGVSAVAIGDDHGDEGVESRCVDIGVALRFAVELLGFVLRFDVAFLGLLHFCSCVIGFMFVCFAIFLLFCLVLWICLFGLIV